MKARELIGNLVLYENSPVKVIGLHTLVDKTELLELEIGTGINRGIDRVEPIPLTEEWLIKFRFVKYDDGGELHGGDCFYISKKNNIAIGLTPKYNLSGYRNVRIEYVHQLQNLYFALTGEELTLKTQP